MINHREASFKVKYSDLDSIDSSQDDRKVYSVSGLNREIRTLLERSFSAVWLEAEISNFKHHSSGHMYLSLKDDKAQINAVFFSRANAGVKFQIKDGLKVLVFGKISLYEPRGQYQFYIERMQPQGLGELQLAFQQLKEKLFREGLFEPSLKKPIPKFPRTVGIITSPTGAAIRDILNVIGRRFHGTSVLLFPVRVQGEGSGAEISRAILEMNKLPEVDVLIVGRGGGSLEDLWAFNEEQVARAVFASQIPVISAVGHEIDWTICDWVADLRAPTPSAAAELVVQNREDFERRLGDLDRRGRQALGYQLEGKRRRLEALLSSYALQQPVHLLQQYSQRNDELMRQLQNYLKAVVSNKGHLFSRTVGRLEALSPLAILQRGYSITKGQDGKVIKDIRQTALGDVITTRLEQGRIKSQVTELLAAEEKEHG